MMGESRPYPWGGREGGSVHMDACLYVCRWVGLTYKQVKKENLQMLYAQIRSSFTDKKVVVGVSTFCYLKLF